MRRALGLEGEQPRPPATPPSVERTPVLGRPKRRFVADGDVPVVHGRLQRRDELAGALATPAPNRIEAAEAAARTERDAREKAERSLADAQTLIHDLQTRLGHAQLAATEAQGAIEAERVAAEALRDALRDTEQQLAAARAETLLAEHRLQAAQAAATTPRSPLADPQAPAQAIVRRRGRPRKVVTTLGIARQPGASATQAAVGAADPKPIRWWLKSKTNSKRR